MTTLGSKATEEESGPLRAEVLLKEARGLSQALHQEGNRERYRALLAEVIEAAQVELPSEDVLTNRVRWALLEAHAARAESARYGAGQLARGSQRAPTEEDCEDGWARVESIILEAEDSARMAAILAEQLKAPKASRFAQAAHLAAEKARELTRERNRSYTFHTDPGFSFGEGWYLAAASLLAGVEIQLEEGPLAETAELFLREAGLSDRLRPFRARPRANKALPEIVARAFRSDAPSAQAKLRAAFLGREPVPIEIRRFAEQRLAGAAQTGAKVLLWVRKGVHQKNRNTDFDELSVFCQRTLSLGLTPVLIGDGLDGWEMPEGAVSLALFWKEELFRRGNMRRSQLQLFEVLKEEHGVVGQMGVTTAGMDGPALLGMPTMYITEEPNVRLGRWVGAVPGYEEIVRRPGYLERISFRLAAWSKASEPRLTR